MDPAMDNNQWRRRLHLFSISFLSLFLELALIRWIGVEIRVFSYFRNLALISCFLGLGVGFSLKRFKPGLLSATALTALLAAAVHPGAEFLGVSLRKAPEYLTGFPEFHMWYGLTKTTGLQVLGGFVMIALVVVALAGSFVPFGQILGHIFESSDNRIRDYSINLVGSLCGTWAFALMSYLATPPWMWFLIAGGGVALLVEPRPRNTVIGAALAALVALLTVERPDPATEVHWSPYQKLKLTRSSAVVGRDQLVPFAGLEVNSVVYMYILDLSEAQAERFPAMFNREEAPYYPYNLPYRFRPRPGSVLIVGAGAGNDAAAALRNGAGQVDAVEIDSTIGWLGIRSHPERPYEDPRVRLVIDDARSFFKSSDREYDLIVFGLLDSHTLTSNFTNINLDSYVYTRESFAEAKARLAENGVMAVSFQTLARPWLSLKLYSLITDVFDEPPIVVHNYSRTTLHGTPGTLFLCGDLDGVRRRIQADPRLGLAVAERLVSPESFAKLAGEVEFDVPSDDWPYLYLQKRRLPSVHVVMMALTCLLMLAAVRFLFPGGRLGPSHFLFLGAGFMLVEVHSISKAALLFGSTWIVNPIIISAILVMILAANLIVLRWEIERLHWWYAGLFATLALSYLVPVHDLIVGGYFLRGMLTGLFYAAPLFFAGVIFATSIRRVEGVEAAFAANMLGAAIGGMLESASYLFGLRAVVIVAVLLYAASVAALLRMPVRSAGVIPAPKA